MALVTEADDLNAKQSRMVKKASAKYFILEPEVLDLDRVLILVGILIKSISNVSVQR